MRSSFQKRIFSLYYQYSSKNINQGGRGSLHMEDKPILQDESIKEKNFVHSHKVVEDELSVKTDDSPRLIGRIHK